MLNTDILRRLRYTFDFDDNQMMSLFASGGVKVNREQVSNWLKKEEDEGYQPCNDRLLAAFLNGLINDKRGKRDGPQPEPEQQLNNNVILRKLKIALNMQDEDILATLQLARLRFSKHELSALFRKPTHKHYRQCQDQILRNFLMGLQQKYRPDNSSKNSFQWKT